MNGKLTKNRHKFPEKNGMLTELKQNNFLSEQLTLSAVCKTLELTMERINFSVYLSFVTTLSLNKFNGQV